MRFHSAKVTARLGGKTACLIMPAHPTGRGALNTLEVTCGQTTTSSDTLPMPLFLQARIRVQRMQGA